MDSSGFEQEHGLYHSTHAAPSAEILSHAHRGVTHFLFSGPLGEPLNESKQLLVNVRTGFFLTCADFRSRLESVQAGLSSLVGVSKGDVVLILLKNSVYFPVILHAVLSIGAVATTANPANTQSEIEYQVDNSKAKFVFTVPELLPKLGTLNRFSGIITLEEEQQELSISATPPNIVEFTELLSFRSSKLLKEVTIRQHDPATLLYSSGTTGRSKGVILSHGNLISATAILAGFSDAEPVVSIILMPLYHVAGFVMSACHLIRAAATQVVLDKFDMIDMLEAIQRYRISHLSLVPPIVIAMTKHPAVANYDLSSLKKCSCGAAPLSKETSDSFLARFPHIQEFYQRYGMTETTAIGAYGPGPFGSCGRLAAGHQAKVIDVETFQPLPPFSTGELCLRGPCIMQGYLRNPSATHQAIDDQGWLHTGDLVYFDSNGHLYVVDRIKELIKYKAYQVAPAELEALLLTHPDVADGAVIPYPDEDAGEVPLAYIVRHPGKYITEKDIIEFIAKKVAPHKKIRRAEFLDAIPKSPSGKILRKNLVKLSRCSKL